MSVEITTDNWLDKALFIIEAQLFHGCTRQEALMLLNDGITTLHVGVEATN